MNRQVEIAVERLIGAYRLSQQFPSQPTSDEVSLALETLNDVWTPPAMPEVVKKGGPYPSDPLRAPTIVSESLDPMYKAIGVKVSPRESDVFVRLAQNAIVGWIASDP